MPPNQDGLLSIAYDARFSVYLHSERQNLLRSGPHELCSTLSIRAGIPVSRTSVS